jgi:hypothetical protein
VALPRAASAQDACDAPPECRTAGVEGVQPCSFDVERALDRAANGALGLEGPPMPAVRTGCLGGTVGPGRVPCQLLRAFAWARTGWRQFCAEGCGAGARGTTRLGASCGIGLTALPEDEPPVDVDPQDAAASVAYNAGAGAARLAEAWGRTPCVGQENPDVAEHWYFAVWAADAFTFANNPNNPAYPVLRRTYGSEGAFDRSSYPFQEVVYGLAAHPPADRDTGGLWEPSPVSLPASQNVCGTAGCLPANIQGPSVVHDRACPPFVAPTDGGAGDDGGEGGPDGGADAGTIPGDPRPEGCNCGAAGRGTSRGGWALAALGLAIRSGLARRSRRGRSSPCSGPR